LGCVVTIVVGLGALTLGFASSPNRETVSQPVRNRPVTTSSKAVQTVRAARDGARAINEDVTGMNPFCGSTE
jgi:hypothetical protein